MREALKVLLWDKEIGRLSWDEHRRCAYFTYNPAILASDLDIAPLVASIKDIRSRMPIYGEDDRKYQGLPSFLADSLPDSWGNQLFEYWRSGNKLSNADITPLEKLSFIGKRGMGALEFEPELLRNQRKNRIDVPSLIDLAQRIYSERENAGILPEESLTLQSLIAVGTSAGGRQPKAIIAINPSTGEIRSGQVSGLRGFDYCIIKFGDFSRSSAELEMVYYEMARKAGINMMESRLIEVDGRKHFLTKRFDRYGEKKLHIQTLAALYPNVDSYEKLLWVCRKMRLSENDCEEVFRRMVFNLLANNTDDYDKNFAFVMDDTGHWNLSPAYDMTFIFNHGGYQPQIERCMMIRGKLSGITKQDILEFASDNGIRRPESIMNEVASAVSSFADIASRYKVKIEWSKRIEACLNDSLHEWEFITPSAKDETSFVIDGHTVLNARIEQAYKGNYHLLATIDGKEQKYVIRKGTKEHEAISNQAPITLANEWLMQMVRRHLVS